MTSAVPSTSTSPRSFLHIIRIVSSLWPRDSFSTSTERFAVSPTYRGALNLIVCLRNTAPAPTSCVAINPDSAEFTSIPCTMHLPYPVVDANSGSRCNLLWSRETAPKSVTSVPVKTLCSDADAPTEVSPLPAWLLSALKTPSSASRVVEGTALVNPAGPRRTGGVRAVHRQTPQTMLAMLTALLGLFTIIGIGLHC